MSSFITDSCPVFTNDSFEGLVDLMNAMTIAGVRERPVSEGRGWIFANYIPNVDAYIQRNARDGYDDL
jgi:hypothetical protein